MRGSLSAEINEMAHGLAEFGKRCADAGRDWLNDRRSEMNRDPQGRGHQSHTRGERGHHYDTGDRRWGNRDDGDHVYYGSPGTPREAAENYRDDQYQETFSPRSGYEGYGGPGSYGPRAQQSSQRDFGRNYGGSDYRQEANAGSYGRSEPYRSQASGQPNWESDRTAYEAQRSFGSHIGPGDRRYQSPGASGEGAEELHGFRGHGPRNFSRSDDRIREDVCERLFDADDIDASGMSVTVNQGVVTLDGEVSHRCMKHWAEDLTESCSGVRDVDNRLRVRPRESLVGTRNPFASTEETEQSTQGQSGHGQARTTAPHTGTDTPPRH